MFFVIDICESVYLHFESLSAGLDALRALSAPPSNPFLSLLLLCREEEELSPLEDLIFLRKYIFLFYLLL